MGREASGDTGFMRQQRVPVLPHCHLSSVSAQGVCWSHSDPTSQLQWASPLIPGRTSCYSRPIIPWKTPQTTMLFIINMIFNKWNNAPFYSKPFLLDLRNSLLNVLNQCLCINTISLFRFIYNKAILTSIHRKLCSGFNNVSFHSGIHRWLKNKN